MGEAVFLVGDGREVGELQGTLQRSFLQERIGRILQSAEAESILSVLQARADRFGEVLAARCPHWLEEVQGISSGAGIEAWQLLAQNCLPENFWGAKYSPAPL